jgi:hypothetical protein
MSDGKAEEYRLDAGQLLALHDDHRRGLHVRRNADCTDCTFDALQSDFPEPVAEFATPTGPEVEAQGLHLPFLANRLSKKDRGYRGDRQD